MNAKDAQKTLRLYVKPGKAEFLKRFFKTGPGEYAEGDILIGVMVPDTRIVAKRFSTLPLSEVQKLLRSKIHEERLLALMILTGKFKTGDGHLKKQIYQLYLKNFKHINNWDLVDSSARDIVGAYLYERDRSILYKFAKSNHLWTRRISIISTFYFIEKNDYSDTLKICALLMKDKEDLIHKATGWMLRELGKRDPSTLEKFLKKHCKKMPRTMLRYSIERLTITKRKAYMKK